LPDFVSNCTLGEDRLPVNVLVHIPALLVPHSPATVTSQPLVKAATGSIQQLGKTQRSSAPILLPYHPEASLSKRYEEARFKKVYPIGGAAEATGDRMA
jgi:hypothetical protein